MNKVKLSLIILVMLSATLFPLNVFAEESKEQLLESVLMNRYYPLLKEEAKNQFECESVINIKRLGGKNEFVPKFETEVQIVTYEGAHNPPNDIVKVTIEDTLGGLKVVKTERKENVNPKEVKKACANWREKVKAHEN